MIAVGLLNATVLAAPMLSSVAVAGSACLTMLRLSDLMDAARWVATKDTDPRPSALDNTVASQSGSSRTQSDNKSELRGQTWEIFNWWTDRVAETKQEL